MSNQQNQQKIQEKQIKEKIRCILYSAITTNTNFFCEAFSN